MSTLQPRQYAVAYCSKGTLGLILSTAPVAFTDGVLTWTGIHLRHDKITDSNGRTHTVKPTDPWTSRNPRVLGYLENFYISLQPKE